MTRSHAIFMLRIQTIWCVDILILFRWLFLFLFIGLGGFNSRWAVIGLEIWWLMLGKEQIVELFFFMLRKLLFFLLHKDLRSLLCFDNFWIIHSTLLNLGGKFDGLISTRTKHFADFIVSRSHQIPLSNFFNIYSQNLVIGVGPNPIRLHRQQISLFRNATFSFFNHPWLI